MGNFYQEGTASPKTGKINYLDFGAPTLSLISKARVPHNPLAPSPFREYSAADRTTTDPLQDSGPGTDRFWNEDEVLEAGVHRDAPTGLAYTEYTSPTASGLPNERPSLRFVASR